MKAPLNGHLRNAALDSMMSHMTNYKILKVFHTGGPPLLDDEEMKLVQHIAAVLTPLKVATKCLDDPTRSTASHYEPLIRALIHQNSPERRTPKPLRGLYHSACMCV